METDDRTDGPKWSLWDVLLVLVLLFCIIPVSWATRNLVKQAISAVGLPGTGMGGLFLFVGTLVQAMIMVLAVVFLTRRKGATVKDLGLVRPHVKNGILLGLAGGLALGIGVVGVGALISMITGPPPPQDVERLLAGLKSGKDILLPFISVSILAPISEELYFRGMAYPVIRNRFGPVLAMVISATFFGALHFDLYRLIPITIGGTVLAYFYEKTGSLLTSMVAHSTWNTFMLLLMYAGGSRLAN